MRMKIAGSLLIAATLTGMSMPAHAQQCGHASWYALTSKTASGERMNPEGMTAAHRHLPFGSKLKVTNPRNGNTVTVRINDRGPFIKGRVLDLSRAAARELGFLKAGVTKVCFSVS
jgi:rare lipoprotein A